MLMMRRGEERHEKSMHLRDRERIRKVDEGCLLKLLSLTSLCTFSLQSRVRISISFSFTPSSPCSSYLSILACDYDTPSDLTKISSKGVI